VLGLTAYTMTVIHFVSNILMLFTVSHPHPHPQPSISASPASRI
jgi:hypothetical protein